MRRLMIDGSAASSAGDDHRPTSESFGREAAPRERGQRPYDEKEEKTAEVNTDDELFATGHFPVDDSAWEGLETAYNFHLQLAPGPPTIPCPICLRVTQTPTRQDCGHVLCFYCMQQSIAALGDCPLCQAQQIFKTGKSDLTTAPETEMRTMYAQDLHLPISSSAMLSLPYQSSIVQVDQTHYANSRGSGAITAAISSGFDGKTHHDLLSNPGDGPLQLDNLSDLDDVIDLDDLVSSDSERPSPPVAARTSLSVLHGMAILYGGYGHPQRLSDTFALRFDTETPTWVELQPRGDLPGPSSTHSVCVVKDRMYLFGGYDGKYRRGQLFAFEIVGVSNERIDCVWRKVETQGHGPASRYTHSGASIGSQLIVYGGNTGCLKGDAYVLDLGTGEEVPTWKLAKCDPPLTPRAWHRAVVYNDAMYVFGGHTADGNDNNVMRVAIRASAP
ncbi:hypothetical protein PRNP1_009473 [Phytophthora ramorum]